LPFLKEIDFHFRRSAIFCFQESVSTVRSDILPLISFNKFLSKVAFSNIQFLKLLSGISGDLRETFFSFSIFFTNEVESFILSASITIPVCFSTSATTSSEVLNLSEFLFIYNFKDSFFAIFQSLSIIHSFLRSFSVFLFIK